jgi:hypothetical protein
MSFLRGEDNGRWDCMEIEIKRLQMNITKEIWKAGKEEMEKQYVKKIGRYNEI